MDNSFFKRRLFGSFLVFIASAGLIWSSIALWQKFNAPRSLAKILPATTFAFFELAVHKENGVWQDLKARFRGVSLREFLEVETDLAEILALAERRIGFGFVGAEFSPRNFVVVLDVADPQKVLALLQQKALPEEKLLKQNIAQHFIFLYPRSRSLAFTFQGNDLILASNLDVLQAVLAVAPRLAVEPEFRAALQYRSPQDSNFGFVSTRFLEAVARWQASRISQTIWLEFARIWQGVVFTVRPQREGVRIFCQGLLTPEMVRQKLFLASSGPDFFELEFLSSQAKIFFASFNLAGQVENFFAQLERTNAPLALLLKGIFQKAQFDFLGRDFSFPLNRLAQEGIIFGQTEKAEPFVFFKVENLAEFQQALLNSQGLLVAQPKNLRLPDGTLAPQLGVPKSKSTSQKLNLGDFPVTRLNFPGFTWNFLETPQGVFASPDWGFLEALSVGLRSSSGAKDFQGFANFPQLFYLDLAEAEIALVQPFRFLLAGLRFNAEGLLVEVFLGPKEDF